MLVAMHLELDTYLKEDFDYLIMDGDGEDRPVEIKNFMEKILNNQIIL